MERNQEALYSFLLSLPSPFNTSHRWMIKLAVTLEDGFASLAYLAIHLSNGGASGGGRSLPRRVRTKSRMTRGVKAESRVTRQERQVVQLRAVNFLLLIPRNCEHAFQPR